jgi:tetratricopeptide (TPR) repeat protein
MNRLLASFGVVALVACSTAQAPEKSAAPADVPITSKSVEAIEHFKKGRDLADNIRYPEATAELNQAIKLDPDFAMAYAYRGVSTQGPRGIADLEQANTKAHATTTAPTGAQSPAVSNAERLLIEAVLTARRGEPAKSEALYRQVIEAAPGDWRAHMGLAQQLTFQDKFKETIDELNKAIEINPNAGPVYNSLGYAHFAQGETGPAVEALKRYASLNPTEPNPHDSLGEALMAAGDFEQAEAEFKKALELSPQFDVAWQGIAYTKFFRRDWAGGKEAMAEGRKAATRPADRAQHDIVTAVASMAEGKSADGLKQINALQTSADATTIDMAFVPVYRAMLAVESSKTSDAIADSERALASGTTGKLPPFASANLRRWALTIRAAAEGLSADAAGAEKTVAALQKEASGRPDDPNLQSAVHFAQGMLAVAQKDPKGARAHFDQCAATDTYCHWQSFNASRKAADRAGADASRVRLARMYLRDPVYLYARSSVDRLTPKQSN